MWSDSQWGALVALIDRDQGSMVALQRELTSRPALAPTSGGVGEVQKSDYLRGYLKDLKLDVTEHRCPDGRVPCGYRPSLVSLLPGQDTSRTVWIMTHLDVVPPGSLELWNSNPFEAVVQGDRIIGRGVEDNQQELVSSVHAAKALLELGLTPQYNLGLVMVADEETGSQYGIEYVLRNEPRLQPQDLIVVADAGNALGNEIEIAEKSIIWLRIATTGRQAHASNPHRGLNALRAGSKILLHLDQVLHEHFPAQDQLFSPPVSTAEPTKREPNVANINTIPGEDVFYIDCRLLPHYQVEDLLGLVRSEAERLAEELGVRVSITTEQLQHAAPPTSSDASVVKLLGKAIAAVLGHTPKVTGIGGGTVAAFFRRLGLPTAVWGHYAGTAHQPNEYCLIPNMVEDAKVYAYLLGLTPQDVDT